MTDVYVVDCGTVDVGIDENDAGCFKPGLVSLSMIEIDVDDYSSTFKLAWHG